MRFLGRYGYSILVLCALGSLPHDPALAGEVNERIVQSSFYYAQVLSDRYPRDKCFLLNFGVSTNFISTALSVLDPKAATDSYFREVPLHGIHDFRGLLVDRTESILEKIIPDEATLAGRTLVFHRVLSQAWGLTILYPRLMEFMRTRRPNTRFTFYLIGTTFPSSLQWFPGSPWGRHGSRLVWDKFYSKELTLEHDRYAAESPFMASRYLPVSPLEMEEVNFRFRPNPVRARFEREFASVFASSGGLSCAWKVARQFRGAVEWVTSDLGVERLFPKKVEK